MYSMRGNALVRRHYFVFSSNVLLQLILNFVFQFLHYQWQKPCFPAPSSLRHHRSWLLLLTWEEGF